MIENDPGPERLLSESPLERVNSYRVKWELDPLPDDEELNQIVRSHGFTACENVAYK